MTAELPNCRTAELGRPDSQSVRLQGRTKVFAVRIVRMFETLPRKQSAYVLGKQVLRSGTSVAANYRAACRARSKAEFISKIAVVAEEADETVFWLELMVDTDIVSNKKVGPLLQEAHELAAIFTAAHTTARQHSQS